MFQLVKTMPVFKVTLAVVVVICPWSLQYEPVCGTEEAEKRHGWGHGGGDLISYYPELTFQKSGFRHRQEESLRPRKLSCISSEATCDLAEQAWVQPFSYPLLLPQLHPYGWVGVVMLSANDMTVLTLWNTVKINQCVTVQGGKHREVKTGGW